METKETTPVAEDNATEEISTNTEATEVAPAETAVAEEVTVGDMVAKDTRVVDQNVFVSEKKARKAAEKELKALKASIEEGASDTEVSKSISEIAEEHSIDKAFLNKLVSAVKSETSKELETKISEQFESKEKEEKFDTAFENAYKKAMEKAPDLAELANPDVIKLLAVQPQNAKKTVTQLLEEIYGNAVPGKRTIETNTKPGGGKEPQGVDYKRAQTDGAYFKEIMANPTLKAKYNETALEEVTRYL